MAVGGVVKVVLSYVLIGIPQVAAKGSTISTVVSYVVMVVLNLIAIRGSLPQMDSVVKTALPLVLSAAVMGGVSYGFYWALSQLVGSRLALVPAILLAIVGFMVLWKISQPMNPIRITVLAGCGVALVLSSIYLGDLFAITAMSTKCIMLFIVFSIAAEPVFRYLSFVVEALGKFGKRLLLWHEKNKGKTA